MKTRGKLLVVAASIALLTATACGSNSLDQPVAGQPPSQPPSGAASVDPALAAKLPEKIKSAGKIVIGTDASYAPNEFLAADGKTIQGMDVDLFNAVAAKFGVKTEWQPADFASIITGVQGKKYDIGISSFTINDERKQQVDDGQLLLRRHPVGDRGRQPEARSTSTTPAARRSRSRPARSRRPMTCRPGRPSAATTRSTSCRFKGQDQATNAVVTGKAERDAGRLAGHRVRGQAVRRQARDARRHLRGGSVRLRAAEGPDRLRRRRSSRR